MAEELNKIFLEVIVANGFEKSALKILKSKKNLRLIDATNYSFKEILRFISSNEELLLQTEDLKKFSNKNFKIVSKKKPSFQISKTLDKYLNNYKRKIEIPIFYEDLKRFSGSVSVYNEKNVDTWWVRVFFSDSERKEIDLNLKKVTIYYTLMEMKTTLNS